MTRTFSVSHLVLAVVALLVGIGLGTTGARGEARALQTRIAELEARSCNGASAQVGERIAEAFQRGVEASRRIPRPAPAPAPAAPDGASDAEAASPNPVIAAPDAEAASSDAEVVVIGDEGDEDRGRLDDVGQAMDLRRTQARQALLEQAGLTDDELMAVDRTVDDMNDQLAGIAADFVDTLRASDGEPDRRESMIFARDTIDVLLDADDALYDTIGPDRWTDVDARATDPLSYVDGSVVEALRELDR